MTYEEALQKAIAEAKDAQDLAKQAVEIAKGAIGDAKGARAMAAELTRQASFVLTMVGGAESALNSAIEWFADNMEPGDVFDGAKLEAWALAAGFHREE